MCTRYCYKYWIISVLWAGGQKYLLINIVILSLSLSLSLQMQWLWLCCYFQLETINNLETRSCRYIWQFSNNKSTCLTFINHKTVNKLLTSVRFPNCFATTYQRKSENRCDGVGHQWFSTYKNTNLPRGPQYLWTYTHIQKHNQFENIHAIKKVNPRRCQQQISYIINVALGTIDIFQTITTLWQPKHIVFIKTFDRSQKMYYSLSTLSKTFGLRVWVCPNANGTSAISEGVGGHAV